MDGEEESWESDLWWGMAEKVSMLFSISYWELLIIDFV
jgi:hypothetical protein